MVTAVALVMFFSSQVWASCALNTGQEDICLNRYSWSITRNSKQHVYQYTVTETTPHCSDACQLGGSMQTVDTEHAEKVHEVHTDFYGSVDDDGDVITCLNITFEVNRHSSSNLEGFIFTLQDHWNRDYKKCFRLNFTTGLNSQAIYDSTTHTKNRLFHFDCFCDLKISDDGPNEYTLKIRSLPFQSEDCTLIDDQTVTLPVRVPVCDDAVRTWTDRYCETTPEETWNPSIAFYQAFPKYNTVRLTFEPAPHHYAITQYEIYIYHAYTLTGAFFVDGQVIHVGDLAVNPTEVGGSLVNATSMEYKVNAESGDNITVTIITRNGIDEVTRIDGPVIIFQENPCESNTCGPLGSCFPFGEDFYCQCEEGALNMNNQTCIQNPCESNLCGSLGSCIPLGQEYYCQCREGALNINHTCIQNPCESNTCGPFGSCIALGQDYSCQCIEGALNRNNQTCIRREDGLWQIITAAAVVGAFAVFIIMVICLYCKCCGNNDNRFPISDGDTEDEVVPLRFKPRAPTSDDILFAYPEGNYEFVNLVELLAILLRTHGGIRPVLPSQRTLEIGRQGQELWLERTSATAKKILWICSAELNKDDKSSYTNFEKLLALTKDEREERKEKHVVCFFSAVSSRRDVPRRLCEFQRFNLLQELESMCLYLMDIEEHTMLYSSSMPYISGRKPSVERTALERALERWSGNRHEDSGFLMSQELPAPPDSGFQFVEAEDNDSYAMADAWQGLTGEDEDGSDNSNDSAYDDRLTGNNIEKNQHSGR